VDYSAFVTANARAFLQARGIGFEELSQLACQQGFENAQVLLTSSPVHGIATVTSDIDLICICDHGVSAAQMATQIHGHGQHFELLPFAAADTERAFADLAQLAEHPLPLRLAGYHGWDAQHAVRRKYLERLVYAVDIRGGAPLISHLPAAAKVVATTDYDGFHQSHVCAWLALRAEEPGACHGYLINACLAAMSTLLSLGGWFLSNKKWILRRWNLAQERLPILEPQLASHLTRLSATLHTQPATESLAQLQEVNEALSVRLDTRATTAALDSQSLVLPRSTLMGAAGYLHGADGFSHLAAFGDAWTVPRRWAELPLLEQDHARHLLRSVRSGALGFSLAVEPAAAQPDLQHAAH